MEKSGPGTKKSQAGRPHPRPAGPPWRHQALAFLQEADNGLKHAETKAQVADSTDIPSGGLSGPQLGPYSSSAAPTK